MVNIKQLIKDKGISQVELSRLLNEHTSVVSLLVNGKRELTEAHLARLVEIFGEEVISQYDGLTDYEVAEKDVMVNIKGIITDFNLTQTDIAKIMGEPQSVISTLANGKRKQTRQHIDALIAHFGQEVIDKYTLPADTYEPKSRVATVTIIDPEIIEEAKELGREEVRQQKGSDTQDVEIEEIANFSLPFASNDIVQSREIDIKALVESKSPKLERYPIGQKLAGVSYAQRIITEAMINADFHPGDVICLTYLEGKSQLLSGYAYLLDTKEYGALFRLVTINEDGTLLLESANPRFRAIRLHDDEVRSYARLLMMIRTNFSFNRGAQFAEIVRSRDEQIMKLTSSHRELITAQAQVLQNQAELIAEIRDSRKRTDALVDKIINNKE